MLFVFVCISLFCFLDDYNDGVAYLFRSFTNPGLRDESESAIFMASKIVAALIL